jgi:hypothetical protein
MEGIAGVGARIAGAGPAVGATWNGVARSTTGEGARWRCAAGAGDAVRGRGGGGGCRASMAGNRDATRGGTVDPRRLQARSTAGKGCGGGRWRSERERQNPRALMQRGGEDGRRAARRQNTGNCARLQ